MASEIRVNKINNRAGLGTVTYTVTGIIVSGIVTANSFKGDGSSLTGIDATSLKDSAGNVKIQAQASGAVFTGIHTFTTVVITSPTGFLDVGSNIQLGNAGVVTATSFTGSGANLTSLPSANLTGALPAISGANLTNLTAGNLTGALPAISGANLTNLPPSAPVGGASTNTVFFENDKEVAVNYQITSTKNAMTAGPVAINAGIAVTVPSGCAWTIV